MIKIMHKEVSPFLTNCYLVIDKATSQAALVDPGDDPDLISGFIDEAGVTVKHLLATHCHVDHVSAAAEMAKRLGLGLMAGEEDAFLLELLPQTCSMYGLKQAEVPEIVRPIRDGDELDLGEEKLRFYHTPGHSPGAYIIQAGEEDILVGDLVFAGSIGRTDLPGGDYETLRNSVMKVLLPLGDAMRLHPGHGPATTIAYEKKNNPFILEWQSNEKPS